MVGHNALSDLTDEEIKLIMDLDIMDEEQKEDWDKVVEPELQSWVAPVDALASTILAQTNGCTCPKYTCGTPAYCQ